MEKPKVGASFIDDQVVKLDYRRCIRKWTAENFYNQRVINLKAQL